MRPLISPELRHEIDEKLAAANEYFDSKRRAGIALYGWDPSCECVDCGDTGIKPETNRACWCEVGRGIAEQKELGDAWMNLVPVHHRTSRLATHPNQNAREIGYQWLRVDYPANRGMLLAGDTGTGKTGLAVAVAYELHMQGVPVRFWTTVDMLDHLRPGDNHSPDLLMDQLKGTGLLVIDDLGLQKETEWTVERMTEIVDGRQRRGVPTIITTNLNSKEFKAQVGDRVWSRCFETMTIHNLQGPDIRKQRLAGVA